MAWGDTKCKLKLLEKLTRRKRQKDIQMTDSNHGLKEDDLTFISLKMPSMLIQG